MNATNPIITRLTSTLTAKTEAALSQLAQLEADLTAALAAAEIEAEARVNRMADSIWTTAASKLSGFEDRIHDLAAQAMTHAMLDLGQRIDALAGGRIEAEAVSQAPECGHAAADFDEEAEVWAGLVAGFAEPAEPAEIRTDDSRKEDVPHNSTPTIAAYALPSDGLAVIDEDDDLEDAGDPDADEDSAASVLYEKRGQGRGTRYVEVDLPEPGETYFRKDGKSWEPVVFS